MTTDEMKLTLTAQDFRPTAWEIVADAPSLALRGTARVTMDEGTAWVRIKIEGGNHGFTSLEFNWRAADMKASEKHILAMFGALIQQAYIKAYSGMPAMREEAP